MSKKKEPPATSVITTTNEDFDPTRLDGESGLPALRGEDGDRLERLTRSAFAEFIPSSTEISRVVRDMFGIDLAESVLSKIIEESEEISHSTRKILAEHMRMGGSFVHIRATVENAFTVRFGDSRVVRDRAASLVNDYFKRMFRKSKSTISNYERCYRKFIDNTAAIEILSQTDMIMLVRSDAPDELINLVIDAKNDNPQMTTKEIERIVNAYKESQRAIAERDNSIETLSGELSDTAAQLDETRLENRRLTETRDRLERDIEIGRQAADNLHTELNMKNNSVSALHREVLQVRGEVETLHRDLADARANVKVESVEVPTIPGQYTKMEDAYAEQLKRFDALMTQLRALEGQLAEQRAEQQRIEAELQERQKAIAASKLVETKLNQLIEDFGSFTQKYSIVQLLVTADGKPHRFRPVFQSLADLVGKFHTELVAATAA